MCFNSGNIDGVEGCSGFIKPAGTLPNVRFVGKTIKTVVFNTTRGGKVAGDDVYRQYNVAYQAPPDNLAAEGFPVAVCNKGEGGGELYNRSASVMWGDDQDDGPLAKAGTWQHPYEAVVHMMHNGWGNIQYKVGAMAHTVHATIPIRTHTHICVRLPLRMSFFLVHARACIYVTPAQCMYLHMYLCNPSTVGASM